MYNLNRKKVLPDGRAKLSDGRENALPCPPLAMPMVLHKLKYCTQLYCSFYALQCYSKSIHVIEMRVSKLHTPHPK